MPMGHADPDTFGGVGRRTKYLLGIAYLLVGAGLFVALLVDSLDLLVAVLVGILGVTLVSLIVIVRAEGIVTTENKVIGVCVASAIGLLVVLQWLTEVPQEAVFALVFFVGVIVPHVILGR